VLHGFDVARLREHAAFGSALILAATVAIQVALGVTTLLYQAPLALALMHQAMAMVVLTAAVMHAGQLVQSTTARLNEPVRARL
jgi:cytochrome c oxidase assembly protein subunit 15